MEWYFVLIIVLTSTTVVLLLSALLYKQFFKRFWDIVFSILAIILLSPLFLILIITGAVAMHGNPFFVQKRPGKKNKSGEERVFCLIKFRTMSMEKDKEGNLLPDSKRLNKYGKFLRSTSLDEIPEIFNILAGSMSFIGPRPQLIKDMFFMDDSQRKRHSVRPGLSGLAQVYGRNNISWEKKFDYDLEYIKNISFAEDIKLFFLTFFKVVKRSDTVREGTSSDTDLCDWLLNEKKISKEEFDNKLEKYNAYLQEAKI